MNQNAILPDNGSPARLLLRLPICDKTLSSEESHDFTLPDYLPEIRKMLRVTVSIDEPESYASASDVEFSGGLTYHVLYTGADGALWAADLPAEYGFSAPIEADERCDLSMGVDAWADCSPELLVTRVLSPRKLNVRCRMRAKACAFAYHSLEEQLSGSPRGRVERLTGMTDSSLVLRGTARGVEVSDELFTESSDDALRVISGEGQVFVTEAVPEKDRVSLRGELVVRLLTVSEPVSMEGETKASTAPTVTVRRLPFAGAIELDGVDRYFDCRGFGVPTKLTFTQEDGRVIIDATLTLTAECQKNARFAFTRDLFSTGAECETAYGDATLPFALRAANGNFTLSDSLPLDGSGISAGDRILDVTGDLTADTVSESAGKTVFSGDAHFHILTKKTESDEYAFGEITLPFRYTADGASDGNKTLPSIKESSVLLAPISIRARCDGERLQIDAEIAVSYRTAGETSVRMLKSARFSDPLPHSRGRILLYYPTTSETLWDAARRYHVSPDVLAMENGMEPSPDTPLKSTKYIVVEG